MIAKAWAASHNIPVIKYPPDYNKYHNEACHKRNEEMAKACDFMLVLWNGESGGSLHDILMADWLCGRNMPTRDNLVVLARILGVKMDDIIVSNDVEV